ncbi:multidrug resistance protein Y [Shigella sonnei]|nr:multidrug resistance protein Y [Shigella sonnei]
MDKYYGSLSGVLNEINNEITQQSLSISANEIFRMAAIAFILLTVLVWFAKPPFTAIGSIAHPGKGLRCCVETLLTAFCQILIHLFFRHHSTSRRPHQMSGITQLFCAETVHLLVTY